MTYPGYRWGGLPRLDPLDVFVMMVRAGNREVVSRELGYHPRSLTKLAHEAARRDEPALLFALEAGKYLHDSRRAQRVQQGGKAR